MVPPPACPLTPPSSKADKSQHRVRRVGWGGGVGGFLGGGGGWRRRGVRDNWVVAPRTSEPIVDAAAQNSDEIVYSIKMLQGTACTHRSGSVRVVSVEEPPGFGDCYFGTPRKMNQIKWPKPITAKFLKIYLPKFEVWLSPDLLHGYWFLKFKTELPNYYIIRPSSYWEREVPGLWVKS